MLIRCLGIQPDALYIGKSSLARKSNRIVYTYHTVWRNIYIYILGVGWHKYPKCLYTLCKLLKQYYIVHYKTHVHYTCMYMYMHT